MKRQGVVMVLVLSSILDARAEPPIVDASPGAAATAPTLAEQYLRVARDAARAGNCDAARETVDALRAIDPSHEGRPVDPAVAICLGTNLLHAGHLRASHEAALAGSCAHVREIVELMRLDGLDVEVLVSPAVLACLVERKREASAPADLVPPLSFSRILGGAALGTLFALPGLYAGYSVGVALSPRRREDGDLHFAPIWSAYAGGVVGVALGVYAVGVNGNQTGSFGATLTGAIVGGLAGVVLTYGLGPAGLLAALVTPYAGALVCFHATRRYEPSKTASRVGSIMTRTNDRWSFGIPIVVHAEHATTLSLVSGSF